MHAVTSNSTLEQPLIPETPNNEKDTLLIDEKVNACMKKHLDDVLQNPKMPPDPQVAIHEIRTYKALKYETCIEECELFCHLARTLDTYCLRFPEQNRLGMQLVYQHTLYNKMGVVYKELFEISPEFLSNLVKVAKYHTYIAKQGEIIQKLNTLDSALLEGIKKALTGADNSLEVIAELKGFLDSVPQEIHASLVKGFIQGIQNIKPTL